MIQDTILIMYYASEALIQDFSRLEISESFFAYLSYNHLFRK